jgi:hypothetical protein
MDPSEARPFLDPYGRAKTVRIGKWRWPPPKTEQDESSDSFLQFKMRQHQRKTTPQQQLHSQVCLQLKWIPWKFHLLNLITNYFLCLSFSSYFLCKLYNCYNIACHYCFLLGRPHIQFSAQKPAPLTKISHGFPLSFQASAESILQNRP